ncbi:hypothetical protein B9C88_09755 [Brevibacillus laterosporus]|uniref:hypothetical protein n=1 Tax=Brevibacillus laterosporus TaxID=1465 RepID=UPI000BCBBFBE|nr:hypothetical protein [Brevibacillus laterosporus]PCN44489.1 hypothetical protein B9C88_09755 [Brevibacillus laterosporus]
MNTELERIKKRVEQLRETEDELLVLGGSEVLLEKQAEIQEYYYADVSYLLEELERTIERV